MQYESEKIKLIPYQEKDQDRLVEIVSDSSQGFLVSETLVKALTKKLTEVDEFHRVWMIESEDKFIGTIILQKINYEHKSAQLVITCDETDFCKDTELFKEVFDQVSEYVFDELDLLRLQVEVLENNLKLKKAYKSVGFEEEGLLRSKYEIKEKRYDVFVMSMLRIEWARGRTL